MSSCAALLPRFRGSRALKTLVYWNLILGCLAVQRPTAAQVVQERVFPVEAFQGRTGRWQSREPHDKPPRGIRIDGVERTGSQITGRVTLEGSRLLRNGTLEGSVRGTFVSGVVRDESGQVAARFVGQVRPDGTMTGTYTDRTGEAGTWQWPLYTGIGGSGEGLDAQTFPDR
ncbi:MAG: hypothetical protein KatS3mg077_2872 [Candidatus Binatia bacterium]|nr:MAG: hypothetical protein KatS3mg077_2872 [Candidatus Binatia bacterium]